MLAGMSASDPPPSTSPRRRPELLAPAGDRLCITAAVENGADAVYFGLECGFNARARATNLHLDSLPEVMAFLHARGVNGYVTLNTLVFPSELAAIERTVIQLTEAGVDAVLVQDLGLVRLIRAISPDLAIHASTQMTLTSAECIRAVEALGIERVVLARELSIDEIRKIHAQTDVELEMFVHGALCVAYSGQCLTSESLGGRSANRGQCAQACRLPYDLICDGEDVDLRDVKYLLSPQDLAAYDLVPELIDAGVVSFKIEGRLKTPEYVANITRHYRRAIDAAVADRPLDFTAQDVNEMELSFSRGFSPGWLGGCDHKMLVPGVSSAKRGVLLGDVTAVRGGRVVIDARIPVAPATASSSPAIASTAKNKAAACTKSASVAARSSSPSVATRLISHSSASVRRFGRPTIRNSPRGCESRSAAPSHSGACRSTSKLPRPSADAYESPAARPTEPPASSNRPNLLAAATKHPLTREVLAEQLGRLGSTVYELQSLAADIEASR